MLYDTEFNWQLQDHMDWKNLFQTVPEPRYCLLADDYMPEWRQRAIPHAELSIDALLIGCMIVFLYRQGNNPCNRLASKDVVKEAGPALTNLTNIGPEFLITIERADGI